MCLILVQMILHYIYLHLEQQHLVWKFQNTLALLMKGMQLIIYFLNFLRMDIMKFFRY